MIVLGYAAVFDVPFVDQWGVLAVHRRGCFDYVCERIEFRRWSCVALVGGHTGHGRKIASTNDGTLVMRADDYGLLCSVRFDHDTGAGLELFAGLVRGTLAAMSISARLVDAREHATVDAVQSIEVPSVRDVAFVEQGRNPAAAAILVDEAGEPDPGFNPATWAPSKRTTLNRLRIEAARRRLPDAGKLLVA